MNSKRIWIIIVVIVGVLLFVMCLYNNRNLDTIEFNNRTYVLLEYNADIFTYNYNRNSYLAEDEIHHISSNKWDTVYFNGDLFILKNQVRKATKYYKDDNNYNWFIVFDGEDNQIRKSVSINKEELKHLYDIEDYYDNITITFDDIECFSDILKVSKDGLVQGVVTLARVDGIWYYKSEVMTDDDREKVIKVFDSLNDKINRLMD